MSGIGARIRVAGAAGLIALTAAAGAVTATGDETGAPPRLTLDRLYSLPRLIGTAPGGFSWSPDGKRLAFLWNDEGLDFRDVWVVDTGDPELAPRRVSRMPRPRLEVPADDPAGAAAARDRWEQTPGVTAVTWHPDGDRLLATFAGDLWLLDANAAPERPSPARRLTATAAAERGALFTPDGGSVVFSREGDLWSLAVSTAADGGGGRPASAQLTRVGRPDVAISSFRLSPDGSRLAVLESDRRGVPERAIPDYLTPEPVLVRLRRAYPGETPPRRRVGVISLGNGKGDTVPGAIDWVDLATPDPGGNPPDLLLSYRWSPDSRRLAIDTSDLYAKDRRIFVVDLGAPGGRPGARIVARDHDVENETFYFWRIAWSRDGGSLYFLSDRDEDYHVWAVEISGEPGPREARRLTHGAWAVAEMYPVEDGLVVVGNHGRAEERQIFHVADGDGGANSGGPTEPARLSIRAGTHAPVISPDGGHAAVAFSSDSTPPDLFLTRLDPAAHADAARRERRVTRSPLEEFSRYRWVTPRYVSFPSHLDGTPLHGRLTLPPDFDPAKKYPAILGSVYTDSVRNQWGGRTAHPTWGLDQYLAQEGYVLLNVDMRGSWGRGREHRRGIRLDYGGMDIEDLESGVRFLAGEGYVDMERVGIWGSSYGGLMTAMSLFRKPGLYAAGVAGAPATNVWHALTGQMAVMMRPEDQPAEYADSSPFLHADGLEEPLMIIHGMRDRIVLFKDSVVLVQRLIQLGKDVDLVALPDAGHGWDNEGLAQTRFSFKKLVQHFDRHVKGEKP